MLSESKMPFITSQKIGILFLFAVIASIILLPLASNHAIPMNMDLVDHIYGIMQAKLAFLEGQFPIRISPLDREGWRYPYFQFYSPTGYTFAGLIYYFLTPFNPYLAYKITIWCALIFGAIYMYRIAFWFVKVRSAAILASVVYLFAPYTAIITYYISAFNELIAIGILPAVIYYSLQTFYSEKINKNFFLASLGWYLLITIHLITFACTTLIFFLFLFLITVQSAKLWKNYFSVCCSYAFGIALSAWFLFPILWLSKYLSIMNGLNKLDFIQKSTSSFFDLFSPIARVKVTSAETAFHFFNSIEVIHPSIGMPMLIGASVCLYAVLKKIKLGGLFSDSWLAPLLSVFVVVFLLLWFPVNIWQWLPKSFMVIEYRWRFLGQMIWISALLFAWMIAWVFNDKMNKFQFSLIVALIACTAIPWLTIPSDKWDDYKAEVNALIEASVYYIDPGLYAKSINLIDSVLVDSASYNKNFFLETLKPMVIPDSTINNTVAPYIEISGKVPDKIGSPIFSANVDGQVTKFKLNPGPLKLDIPIDHPKNTARPVEVAFNVEDLTSNSPAIPLTYIYLGGFLNPEKMIPVKNVLPFCTQVHQAKVCELYVPAAIKLIELPIYFYPKLLNITINGKHVPYVSVLNRNYLIAGVMPIPGVMNTIKVEFVGLRPANFVSQLAWGLWIIFLIYLFLKNKLPPAYRRDSCSLA